MTRPTEQESTADVAIIDTSTKEPKVNIRQLKKLE